MVYYKTFSFQSYTVEYDVKIIRGERQSVVSKDHKSQQNNGSKGNRPDLMIRAYLRNKWDEVAYIESSKWQTSDQKIFDDHNKLVRLTLDGLIRKNEVNFYLPVSRAKILLSEETVDEVEDFIHTLLILRVSIIFFMKY